MSTLRGHPYWGVEPEVLQEIRRRAHEERVIATRQVFAAPTKIVRKLFAGLTWRAPPAPNLRVAHNY